VVASLLASACGLLVGIEPLEVVARDDAAVVSVRDAATGADAADAASVDAPAEVGPRPPPRPPAGTYAYTVVGGDTISGLFAIPAPYGPTATVTVEHLEAGCFAQTIALRSNYKDTMHFCIKGVEFVEDTSSRSQQFALHLAETTTTCVPGDVYFTSAPSPGKTWNHDCTGQSKDDTTGKSTFSAIGFYRFVGNEVRPIAGTDVPVLHFRDERNVTGAQTGTNIADWYLAVEDGMLVRLSRTVDLDYNNIHYHESALLTLTTPPSVLRDAGTD
jgi:hypothetical protein